MNSDTDRDQNITKAKKEVERLDAEEAAGASPTTNGHKASATPEETGIIAKEVELIKGVVANAVAEITGTATEDKTEEKVEEKTE